MTSFGRRPDIDSLALLTEVARQGSLGKAARSLGISQPSASARIDALERRLGVTLLARRSTGSTLTPAGELVVGWSAPALVAVEELSRGAAALRRQRAAELTVAASFTIAEYLLPEWLVHLHAAHPEIAVHLTVANSTDVVAAVLAAAVPVGFVEGPSVPRTVAHAEVGADSLVVVVGPAHPWARRRQPLSMTEFRATPLLLREPGSGTRQMLQKAVGGAANLAPPALELSTTTAIRTAAAGGTAPAVLSELTVRADLAAGRLVVVAVQGLSARRRLRAIWPRGTQLTGPAAALVQLARAATRPRPGGSPRSRPTPR